MNDAPVDETVKDLDIAKVEVNAESRWDTIPETIRELLSQPPLLDQHEQADRNEPLRPREDQHEIVALAEVDDELAVDRRGEEPALECRRHRLEARRN